MAMNIKGTALKTTKDWIKRNYPDDYDNFLRHLPEKSRDFFEKPILSNEWYPLVEGILLPTETIGDLFFDHDREKAAFELGRDSAVQALKGIYKIFVRISSVDFVLKRATTIFSTYYSSGTIQLIENENEYKKFRIIGFTKEEALIFYRIAGWIYGIFDVINQNIDTVTHTIDEEGDLVVAHITAKFLN